MGVRPMECVCVFMRVSVYSCVFVCVGVCVGACVRVAVCAAVYVSVCMWESLSAYSRDRG